MTRFGPTFDRRGARFKPQPRVLVLCEDSKSCYNYLQDAARAYRSSALVQLLHCGHTDPLGIVREAVRRRNEFEEIYCAIDRDEHNNFDEALLVATQNRIQIIDSHPCYEYWLLLPFRETRAPYVAGGGYSAAENLIRELRRVYPAYDKGSTKGLFALLQPRLDQAHAHAIRCLRAAIEDGNPNPSTKLHLLLDSFDELGKPIAAVPRTRGPVA